MIASFLGSVLMILFSRNHYTRPSSVEDSTSHSQFFGPVQIPPIPLLVVGHAFSTQ